MRIGKDATAAVGKYIDTFVREAIARAAYERGEAAGTGKGDGFLEVSRMWLVWIRLSGDAKLNRPCTV